MKMNVHWGKKLDRIFEFFLLRVGRFAEWEINSEPSVFIEESFHYESWHGYMPPSKKDPILAQKANAAEVHRTFS